MIPQNIGRYRIDVPLGTGGMGEVYRAFDERLQRRVAIKLIRTDALTDDEVRMRFQREARLAARLNHPAIVQIYDLREWEGRQALVMEIVDGETLASLLLDKGPLEIPVVLELGRQIVDGLSEAHKNGIIHRDLKTENVMVTYDGAAKILDFGLAKTLVKEPNEVSISGSKAVVGTVRAMSPEQAMGLALDYRTDLFSLGVLLYEISTGISPFRAKTAAETLTRICLDDPPPVSKINRKVSPALSALIKRLLLKEPRERPTTTDEINTELERLLITETGSEERVPIRSSLVFSGSDNNNTYPRSDVPILPTEPGLPADVKNIPSPRSTSFLRQLARPAALLAILMISAVVVFWNYFWPERRPPESPPGSGPPASSSSQGEELEPGHRPRAESGPASATKPPANHGSSGIKKKDSAAVTEFPPGSPTANRESSDTADSVPKPDPTPATSSASQEASSTPDRRESAPPLESPPGTPPKVRESPSVPDQQVLPIQPEEKIIIIQFESFVYKKMPGRWSEIALMISAITEEGDRTCHFADLKRMRQGAGNLDKELLRSRTRLEFASSLAENLCIGVTSFDYDKPEIKNAEIKARNINSSGQCQRLAKSLDDEILSWEEMQGALRNFHEKHLEDEKLVAVANSGDRRRGVVKNRFYQCFSRERNRVKDCGLGEYCSREVGDTDPCCSMVEGANATMCCNGTVAETGVIDYKIEVIWKERRSGP